MDFKVLNAWADRLLPLAKTAGRAILDIRDRGFKVDTKVDKSPVTEADRAAEDIILAELKDFTPAFPIVGEENFSAGRTPELWNATFWLVDALDGTKEFLRGGDDFTVNIALVFEGVPTLGVVHAPARGTSYLGVVDPATKKRRAEFSQGDTSRAISVRKRPSRVVVVGSRSHEMPELMDPFLANYDVSEKVAIGSSLKFCLVAEGVADLYPRFGPTCEWDTGAGHAVLLAAGGRVRTFDGAELRYKKPSFLNYGFLAEGQP